MDLLRPTRLVTESAGTWEGTGNGVWGSGRTHLYSKMQQGEELGEAMLGVVWGWGATPPRGPLSGPCWGWSSLQWDPLGFRQPKLKPDRRKIKRAFPSSWAGMSPDLGYQTMSAGLRAFPPLPAGLSLSRASAQSNTVQQLQRKSQCGISRA